MNHNLPDTTVTWYRRPAVLGLLAIGGFIAVYLAVPNWAQTGPYLPWLLILAIPLLHVFMHGGHGAHGGMGGCGGHGSHGGGHDHGQRTGHSPGSGRALPPPAAKEAGSEKESADCCGGGNHAHRAGSDAPMHAHGGDCCGGAGDVATDKSDDQPKRGLERR